MEFALWVFAAFLALACWAAAGRKLIESKAEYSQSMPWANDFSQRQIWAIGVAEVGGGVGLILPELTGVFPILTPIAAFCIAALQLGAAITHLRRKELRAIPANIVLVCIALFIGLGRVWF
ncbi:MAG: DoxX family protein [Microbacteriaceae bacterium]